VSWVAPEVERSEDYPDRHNGQADLLREAIDGAAGL
jgi:hypothetical protein